MVIAKANAHLNRRQTSRWFAVEDHLVLVRGDLSTINIIEPGLVCKEWV